MGTTIHVDNNENELDGDELDSQAKLSKAAGLTGYVPDEALEGLQIVDSLQKFLVYVYKRVNGDNVFIEKFQDRFPDPGVDIGEKYGGGEYPCKLTWPDPTSKGKNKTGIKNFVIRIGQHYDEISQRLKREAHNSPAIDPMQMTDQILKAAALIAPRNSGGESLAMFKMLAEMQERSERRTAEMIKELRAGMGQQKDAKAEIIGMVALFKELKGVFGNDNTQSTDAQPWWQFLVETISGHVEKVYGIVTEQSKLKQLAMASKFKEFGQVRKAFIELQKDKVAQVEATQALYREVGNDPRKVAMVGTILKRVGIQPPIVARAKTATKPTAKPATPKPVEEGKENAQ